MPQMLSLNGDWSLTWHDDFPQFLTAEVAPMRAQLTAQVPEPVHATLMRHGLLNDPRVGLNSLSARWVEEQFWVYRKVFVTPATSPHPLSRALASSLGKGLSAPPSPVRNERPGEGAGGEVARGEVWLTFTLLEYDAVVYLNGQEIGRHASAHRPARFNVTGKLRPPGEENTLVVRLDAGLYAVADKPGADYQATPSGLLTKRHWQRKGQWQCGWDWQQRLMNVGILGDVKLEWSQHPIVTQSHVYSTLSTDLNEGIIHARVFVQNPSSEPIAADLRLIPTLEQATKTISEGVTVSIAIPLGNSSHSIQAIVKNPELWWPVGHGEPTRYQVALHLDCIGPGKIVDNLEFFSVGFRKVEVDQSAHPEEGKHFILKINNKPIFCKGGNWVPPDMLYSTVTPERLEELVDLAVRANFNLLRIWGGGTWAGHDLLELCDKRGILVWHDLLFACAKYPGDYPEWTAEARREVEWGMREFAHHPSVVVWCGNNEIEEGDWNWGYDRQFRTHPHYALFHHDFPKLAKTEAPYAFYWISSPYSPDYANPTDPTVGDQHPWGVSLRQDGPTDWWEYRSYVDRFPNEGGVLGVSSPATLRQFLSDNQRYLNSPAWDHHDNPFAMQPMTPGQPGRAYQTVQHWTGLDPATMHWEDYAFASALLQAEGLTEYITNYRRRMFSSSAAIFWMYNDSWPTTHGWTIIDYYRRKKLAYHPVRRAFQPLTAVCHREGNLIDFPVINETNETWQGKIGYGVMDTRGQPIWVTLPNREPCRNGNDIAPHRVPPGSVKSYGVAKHWSVVETHGITKTLAFAVLYNAEGQVIAQHRQLYARFHELNLDPNPEIALTLENGVLTLRSNVFVWGVCLDLDGERPVPDNCFDLLPGVPYSLPWDEATLGEPKILRTGNALFAW